MSQIADHRRHRLPKGWKESVKSGIINAISLARYVAGRTRGEAVDQTDLATRSRAKRDQYEGEITLLLEESRSKDTRWATIPAHRRPHYSPTERLAILELRAARGWSLAQTAERFHITAETISSWQQRIDEQGPDALVKLPQPVNKFPEAVNYLVQRLKVLCPTLGKRRIAAKLARAGLHLSPSSVAACWSSRRPQGQHHPKRSPTRRQSASSPPSVRTTSGTST
ncbi:MAG TPA: helix-turn-helix domain-containing protein [Pirellulales bacterium]|nr:helix-turn-helix domain-containing protein [Pirellulales bacterium]